MDSSQPKDDVSRKAGQLHHPVREHRLFDGRTVTIRPIRRDDVERVRRFMIHVSAESRYSRFHKWVAAPSRALIRFLCEIDYDRQMAFVCSTSSDGEEEIVGEARYIDALHDGACEFGILIEDGWRKSGIAGLLMNALMHAARERGFAKIEGFVLADNTAMLRFAHALGFDIEPIADDTRTVRIVLNLHADAPTGATGQSIDSA